MSESQITPMRNGVGDDDPVRCYPPEADFFRVVICGHWLCDSDSLQEAERALLDAHRGKFPKGTHEGNAAMILSAMRGTKGFPKRINNNRICHEWMGDGSRQSVCYGRRHHRRVANASGFQDGDALDLWTGYCVGNAALVGIQLDRPRLGGAASGKTDHPEADRRLALTRTIDETYGFRRYSGHANGPTSDHS